MDEFQPPMQGGDLLRHAVMKVRGYRGPLALLGADHASEDLFQLLLAPFETTKQLSFLASLQIHRQSRLDHLDHQAQCVGVLLGGDGVRVHRRGEHETDAWTTALGQRGQGDHERVVS